MDEQQWTDFLTGISPVLFRELEHLTREVKAKAWDEGYRAGCDDGHDHARGLTAGRDNPYED